MLDQVKIQIPKSAEDTAKILVGKTCFNIDTNQFRFNVLYFPNHEILIFRIFTPTHRIGLTQRQKDL